MSEVPKRNKLALILAIIGGIFLIVSGISGGTGIWGVILNFIIINIGGEIAIFAGYVLTVLIILANLGGITVMVGGFMFYARRITTGRLLNSIGAGIGLIGFIILYIVALISGWGYLITITANLFTTLGGLGILLAIVSGYVAKKE